MPDHDLEVGAYVHCDHAGAEGVVTWVGEFNITVRVLVARGANYTVGCEYAWLPMQVRRIAEPLLN